MADVKFSQFASGGDLQSGDIIVGLRAGVNTQFNSPDNPTSNFLLKSNNLSDVANTTTAFENLGLGRPGILILRDSDFASAGGTYVLTNPPPTIVSMSATSAGRVLQLPPQNQSTSIESSQQIELLTGSGSQSIGINNGAGTLIFLVESNSAWRSVPNDRSTVAGAWEFLGEVQTINAGNGNVSGNIEITSSDGSVNITNTVSDIINFTVPPGAGGSLQNAYNNGANANIALSNSRPILVSSLEGNQFNIYDDTTNLTTLYEALSTTKGTRPFPEMSAAQFSAIASRPIGLHAFTTDFNVTKYWNGTIEQTYLTVDNVLSGSNISVIPNTNGTITISATSGPSAVSSGQANFYTLNTTTATTFTGINNPTPIIVNSTNILYENNFAITQSSGTPNVQFLTTATRQCLINAVFTLRTSSSSTQTYSIYLAIKNGASTIFTNAIGQTTLSPSPGGGPQEISLTYNLSLTGPGDNLQFWIANNSTPQDPVVVVSGAVTILDTTQFGGFSSTDVLPQGVNNLYLSQNSGSTYQNVNGTPVFVNNLASFNTTGGQLKDSGISSASIVSFTPVTVTTATQSMSLNTLYFNNYTGGQCVYSLPAATGSGKSIRLISLNTSSTSGWRVNANGTDKLQFQSSLSAAGGNIQSTVGSSTDDADFIDSATGLWVIYPASGMNLIVT